MHRNVQQQYYDSLLGRTCSNLEGILLSSPREYKHDCGGINTVYPHHRVGYDGQDQVLSFEHAVFVLSEMLSISTHSHKDTSSDSEEKPYVYRYKHSLMPYHFYITY